MSVYFVLALTVINAVALLASRVALPLYALDLGAQPFTVGVLAATFSAFPMMLAVTVGRLADRFGSRWLLIWGSVIGTVGLLVPYFAPHLAAVFVAATVMGVATAIYNVSLQNLVGLLSTPENLAQNFSSYSLAKSSASFIGPLFAGFSIDRSGHAAACLYIGLATLVPVVMLAIWGGGLPRGTRKASHADRRFLSMLLEPGVRKVLAISSLISTGTDLYQFYMPVYAHSVGLSASTIGIILAMNAAAEFVVRTVLPRLIARFKEERLLAYAFYVGAASLLAVPFFENAVMLAAISFAFGLASGCSGPIITMLMFTSSATGRSGEAMGLKVTVNHFTKVVSPIVFGVIGSAFGLSPMFWINAVMLGVGGIVSYPKKRSDKRPG